jgi:AcrR family transcriptional regulator
VYQYFPTKDALISALISFHLKQRMADLDAAIASVQGLGAEEAAGKLVDHLIGSKRVMVKVESAMVRYFVRVGDLLSLTAMDEHMNGAVAKFLTALGTQVRPVNVELASFIISNALRSAVLLSVVQKPERLSEPEFRAELVRLVVNYLRPDGVVPGTDEPPRSP